jgi:phage terminase large subunit-like protein
MERKAVNVVPIYASTPGAAMVDWERLVASAHYNHGGDPVTAWSIRQVVVTDTGAGIWKIARKASRDNVAGPAAAELALRRFLVAGGKSRSRELVSF